MFMGSIYYIPFGMDASVYLFCSHLPRNSDSFINDYSGIGCDGGVLFYFV